MIPFKAISVVVQGPIHTPRTKRVLEAIRRLLPKAQLILSTWEGSDTEGLDYDVCVYSKDPGASPLNHQTEEWNNINRQIISTQRGIERAERPYLLKMRTDLELLSVNFLRYFEQHTGKAEVFRERVLILDHKTRNCRVIPVPFHPSDWLMFGRREDVSAYYAAPLMPERIQMWFRNHKDEGGFFSEPYHQFTPEQWLCLNFLQTKWSIHCRHYHDNTQENRTLTERFFAGSCLIYPYSEKEFLFTKYRPDCFGDAFTLLSQKDWLDLQTGNISPDVYFRHWLWEFRRNILRLLAILGIKEKLRIMLKKRGRR